MSFFLQWIDLIWVPIAYVVARKNQRTWALTFVIGCMLLLRMQVEFFEGIGRPSGVIQIWPANVLYKGFVVYGLVYTIYLLMLHFTRTMTGYFLMALSTSSMVTGFIISILVMTL